MQTSKQIKDLFGTAPPEGLLCFLLKNGSSKKTFGRAPLEEPEPEPERSPAKQVLNKVHNDYLQTDVSKNTCNDSQWISLIPVFDLITFVGPFLIGHFLKLNRPPLIYLDLQATALFQILPLFTGSTTALLKYNMNCSPFLPP